MATGWNFVWGESWKEYVQRSSITNDLTTAHRESSRAMVGAISGQTASILTGMGSMGSQISSSVDRGFNQLGSSMDRGFNQLGSSMDRGFSQVDSSIRQVGDQVSEGMDQLGAAMGEGFDQLGSTMISGFDMLGGQMDVIAGEISGLNASFQWGFGQMIAQMGGMNDALDTLIKLAKEEVQRLAYNHFEIARDVFRRGLYEECLEELDKAISGDHVSSGYKVEWRFHQMQGVVRLGFYGCEPELVDPEQAEKAFVLAARYARADHQKEAAKALMSAGWAAFVQGKLPEALKHTDQAVALDEGLTEALFQAAKVRMAAGEPGEALPILRRAIDQAPAYVIKASADGDFQKHEGDLNDFLEAMRQEQLKALRPGVSESLAEAEKWARTFREVAACEDVTTRWKALLEGGWGLLELLKYSREGFKKDQEAISKAYRAGQDRLKREREAAEEKARQEREKKRNTFVLERRVTRVQKPVEESYQVEERYEVDEPYQVEEEYDELVVVKPSGWFRGAKTEVVRKTRLITKHRKVQKTRMVPRTRQVLRDVEEEGFVIVNGLGEIPDQLQFVRIPEGTFTMGSPGSEDGRSSDETQHEVRLTRAFELQTTPVTQALWQAVMGNNPSHFKGPDRPVEEVSWNDVQEFIGKLNKMLGTSSLRLPTEAEWEYACRAGTTGARYGELAEVAWYDGNSGSKTHAVGQKQPNPWGLYDMLGNVWEWCHDWRGAYPTAHVTDPTGPATGSSRVVRGGSWNGFARNARGAFRSNYTPGARLNVLGFRLARSL